MDGLQWLIVLYFVGGSYSIGYFFLRSGWPKIRLLEEHYKIGWSIALGLLFTLLVVGASWYEVEVLQYNQSFEWFFSLNLLLAMLIAIAALFIRRKYIASQNVQVAVPKDYLTAKKAANQLTQGILSDSSETQPIPKMQQVEGEDFRMEEVKKTLEKLTEEIGSGAEEKEGDS